MPDPVQPVRDSLSSASGIAEYEGFLRSLYSQADRAIAAEAQLMLQRGGNLTEVTEWAHRTREITRLRIRQWDLAVLRRLAEARNIARYRRAAGPTLQQLREGWTDSRGRVTPGRSNTAILESAGRSNDAFNRWVGRFRIAGRIFIGIEITLIAYNVAQAPEVDRPLVLLEGAGALTGAITVGWAAAQTCSAIGAAVGVPAAGVGAIPVAGIGAIVCGIGGGVVGAFGGRTLGRWTAEQLYPTQQTNFEEIFVSD